MVCEKCEAKLKHVVTADPWKHQGRTSDKAGTSAGRKVNENKILTARFDPTKGLRKCRICQSKIHQDGAYYCQTCAYKKGICGSYFDLKTMVSYNPLLDDSKMGMCGKKILNTKSYRQSAT